MARLKVENISFKFFEHEANIIEDFSLEFPDSGFIGIIGPNGIGKSTLMTMISGLLKPRSGKVYLNDIDSFKLKEKQLNKTVSYVYQNMEFDTDEKVNSLLKKVLASNKKKDLSGKLDIATLVNVFEIEDVLDKSISGISKGELQKVILAFSLLFGNEIIIIDEPVFALKYEEAFKILNRYKEFQKKLDLLVIYSLHDLELIKKTSDYVLMLGKKYYNKFGKTEEIFSRENIEMIYNAPMSEIKNAESVWSAMVRAQISRDMN